MEITNKINDKIKKNLIDDELIEDIRILREKGYTLKFNFDNKNLTKSVTSSGPYLNSSIMSIILTHRGIFECQS